jgi:hypothetical protein
MNGVIYKMSKEMYEGLKYPMRYIRGRVSKSDKPLTTKEILEEVNKSFGLKSKVVKIEIM